MHALLADIEATGEQFSPDSRPSVRAVGLSVDDSNVYKQRFIADVLAWRVECSTGDMLVVASGAYFEHTTLHRDRPQTSM